MPSPQKRFIRVSALEICRPPADGFNWGEREPGKPMRRNWWKLVLGLGLLGCGGLPHALPLGFVNQTNHSDAETVGVSKAAQESSDPTGMIACPAPCEVRYAAAYSFCIRDLTRYAASWEEQGDSISFVLEHEFEKQILAALGYSLRWR